MPRESEAIAMLSVLLATCEATVQTFQATDNPAVDRELVADLEHIVERIRDELMRLRATFAGFS